jgi:hypothetical protein
MLGSKSYGHLAAVSQAYNAKYGKTIATVIKEEFSGDLQKVLVTFVEAFEDYPTFLATRLERSMLEKTIWGINYNSKFRLHAVNSICPRTQDKAPYHGNSH